MKSSFVFRKNILIFFLFILPNLWACEGRIGLHGQKPAEGIWRGVIHLQDQELPFNFLVRHTGSGMELDLINGEERIRIDEIVLSNDSFRIPMHIFDTGISGTYTREGMQGIWKKNYLEDYILPFTASYKKSFRFTKEPSQSTHDLNGRWEVYFLSGPDSTLAVGLFNQSGNVLEGTFLKTTGDYRYLEGEVDEDSLMISTFDGEHAYLFKARIITEDTIKGTFWSGKTWRQSWVAIRNPEIRLPDPYSLTFLKPGYVRIHFELPGMDGSTVSLDDPEYQGKVIILQIFGTWCPNCMDETRFLSGWYNRNQHKGVEILAIAFERKDNFSYARERIERMKEKYNIHYDFLFGGKSDKEEVLCVLPMLNTMVSFPTTIFIDKRGKVRKIHTGFAGPGTGAHYKEYIEEFNLFMDKLLQETTD